MKKIISEFRKCIAVILLEHALDVVPDGEFKKEFARFINENMMKL